VGAVHLAKWPARQMAQGPDITSRATVASHRQLFGVHFSSAKYRFWPVSDPCRRPVPIDLRLRLLRHFKGVVNLNPEIPYGTFQFGVTEKQLHCPQILGSPIDQRCFRARQRVSAVAGRIQSQLHDP
jgi:hypothetical protein